MQRERREYTGQGFRENWELGIEAPTPQKELALTSALYLISDRHSLVHITPSFCQVSIHSSALKIRKVLWPRIL